jgi:hypothetical protein
MRRRPLGARTRGAVVPSDDAALALLGGRRHRSVSFPG